MAAKAHGRRAATWIAFGSIVKRNLVTFSPPHRCPRPSLPLPLALPGFHLGLQSSQPSHFNAQRQSRGLARVRFSSNQAHRQNDAGTADSDAPDSRAKAKRKPSRSHQVSPSSLRHVAVEAQQSRGRVVTPRTDSKTRPADAERDMKDVTAYCAAETYHVPLARDLLRREGWATEPFPTGLFPHVLHARPVRSLRSAGTGNAAAEDAGDVFVFPSGTVVAWNVSEKLSHDLIERVLVPAAANAHLDKLEAEDLEYREDPAKDTSRIVGDTIILGTRSSTSEPSPPADHRSPEVDNILAKIAFSSALARSTKLAVLENSLSAYFATTRAIPSTLSAGRKLRFTRAFILRKTGELLSIRAQLNLYSELTDRLPDLFWDSPHALGLETYYEQVGRALDVGTRIRLLNEKMDYASEIAAVLRERLSEKHSTGLEWVIIWLIFIEVGFGTLHLVHERHDRAEDAKTRALLHEFLERGVGSTVTDHGVTS